jgi:hypothetical protein
VAGNSGSGGNSAAGGSGGSGGASGSAGSGGQGGTAGGGGTSGTETDAGVDGAGTDAPVGGDDGGSGADGGAGSDDSGSLTEAGDDSGTVTGPDASVDLGADTVVVSDAPTTGGNCVQQIKSNGYASGTVPACSQCKDSSGNSLEPDCKGMIDCLAPKWPCTGNCWTECHNTVAGGQVVADCVTALTNAACQ